MSLEADLHEIPSYTYDEPEGYVIHIHVEGDSREYAEEVCRGVQSYLDLISELETDDE